MCPLLALLGEKDMECTLDLCKHIHHSSSVLVRAVRAHLLSSQVHLKKKTSREKPNVVSNKIKKNALTWKVLKPPIIQSTLFVFLAQ